MSSTQTNPLDRKTFILRLSPVNPDGNQGQKIEWRGQLQNVLSGAITPFQGIDALYSILQEELANCHIALETHANKKSGGLR